jgi:hypothetical protein
MLLPTGIGDLGEAEGRDDLDHLLALADQDVNFTRLADDLFWTVPLLRHASLLLESV